MKITKLEIISRDKVNQPLYPYVKPTDYYLDILGEKSPTEAAMRDNVSIIKMTRDDVSSSYFNTSSLVADYALTFFGKIQNWDVAEIGIGRDFLYRYSRPLGRAGVFKHTISVINLMMYDLYARDLKVPVYDLLCGKIRYKIKVYASHLHPLPIKELQKEAHGYIDKCYKVMKMRFSSGPVDPNSMEKNEELVEAVRDQVGYKVELAADAWMSWNFNFVMRMGSRAFS